MSSTYNLLSLLLFKHPESKTKINDLLVVRTVRDEARNEMVAYGETLTEKSIGTTTDNQCTEA